jgi:hypothetical protein
VFGIIIELPAECAHVASDGICPQRRVRYAKCGRELAMCDYGAGPRDERVQDDVLVGGQFDVARTLANASAQRVDLEVGDR